ncbi:MAG: protein kinase [Gemmataceae bacterium]
MSEHPEPDVLNAFGRGDLPPSERVAVAEHLSACDTCSAFLGSGRGEKTLADHDPGILQQTNPAPAVSDAHFAPPDVAFSPSVPPELANHATYRIIDQLGEGGMGVVFKAEHRMMGRIVALKLLAPHLTANPAAVDRFKQEVTAAGRLNHPNIVISHDAGEAGGNHFLVMEYVEGISLDRLVARRGPLAATMASHFARQVAQGLQHAADKGMVHRDIKPQNLIVTRKGQVKILDFGLARLARDIETDGEPGKKPKHAATAPNLIMGTPDYLSPEQAKNSHKVDIRSDLYSLGCTLYFLLTGHTPFARATTLIDKLLAHTEEEPVSVLKHRPDLPEGLASVLGKLMAKRPQDRYATPAEAAAALAPFAKGVEATPPPAGSLAPAPAPTFEIVEAVVVKPSRADFRFESKTELETPQPVREKKPSRKKQRRAREQRKKLIGALIAVVVMGLLIGGAVKVIRRFLPDDPVKESAKNDTPPPASPPKNNPPATPPVAKPAPRVLFVLPSRGLWMDDYLPVRKRLEANGVKVFTAAGPGRSFPTKSNDAIETDLPLRPEMDVSSYQAVVFVGQDVTEFVRNGPGRYAAAAVIDKFLKQGSLVCAICEGQSALAAHGALNNKSVAAHPGTRRYPPFESLPVTWEEKSVLADGKLITASGPEHAVAFADAIFRALR